MPLPAGTAQQKTFPPNSAPTAVWAWASPGGDGHAANSQAPESPATPGIIQALARACRNPVAANLQWSAPVAGFSNRQPGGGLITHQGPDGPLSPVTFAAVRRGGKPAR